LCVCARVFGCVCVCVVVCGCVWLGVCVGDCVWVCVWGIECGCEYRGASLDCQCVCCKYLLQIYLVLSIPVLLSNRNASGRFGFYVRRLTAQAGRRPGIFIALVLGTPWRAEALTPAHTENGTWFVLVACLGWVPWSRKVDVRFKVSSCRPELCRSYLVLRSRKSFQRGRFRCAASSQSPLERLGPMSAHLYLCSPSIAPSVVSPTSPILATLTLLCYQAGQCSCMVCLPGRQLP
jgi:hypothetical protein